MRTAIQDAVIEYSLVSDGGGNGLEIRIVPRRRTSTGRSWRQQKNRQVTASEIRHARLEWPDEAYHRPKRVGEVGGLIVIAKMRHAFSVGFVSMRRKTGLTHHVRDDADTAQSGSICAGGDRRRGCRASCRRRHPAARPFGCPASGRQQPGLTNPAWRAPHPRTLGSAPACLITANTTCTPSGISSPGSKTAASSCPRSLPLKSASISRAWTWPYRPRSSTLRRCGDFSTAWSIGTSADRIGNSPVSVFFLVSEARRVSRAGSRRSRHKTRRRDRRTSLPRPPEELGDPLFPPQLRPG
jgi:hypothetical protein